MLTRTKSVIPNTQHTIRNGNLFQAIAAVEGMCGDSFQFCWDINLSETFTIGESIFSNARHVIGNGSFNQICTTSKSKFTYTCQTLGYFDRNKAATCFKCIASYTFNSLRNLHRHQFATFFKCIISYACHALIQHDVVNVAGIYIPGLIMVVGISPHCPLSSAWATAGKANIKIENNTCFITLCLYYS